MITAGEIAAAAPVRTEVFGDPEAAADHVVVAWAATAELIRGLTEPTVIVCRAHPLFASPSLFSPDEIMDEASWPERSAADALIAAKTALLAEHACAVVWAPLLWDAGDPATRSAAMAIAAGLEVTPAPGADQAVVADVPPAPLGALLQRLLPAWKARRALVTGSRDRPVERVALIAGVASPAQLEAVLDDPHVDAILVGDTVEWEGTPFMQDQQTAGRDVPLVAVGALLSEQPANAAVAERLRGLDADVRVETLTDSAWTPEEVR
jgi:putative NIF3 family GTP cyclohydrolase 1 type 2